MSPVQLRQPLFIPLGFGVATLVLGGVLGLTAPNLAHWLVTFFDRSPLPTPGVFQVISGLPGTWSIPIGAGLGLIGAAFIASSIVNEGLRLTVAPDHLEYRQEQHDGWIEHSDIAAVYRSGNDVVVLDSRDRIRARLNAEGLNFTSIKDALCNANYPWHDQDPCESEYERWADGKRGFTPTENRIIREWRRTRRKNSERMEAEEALREANLVVRYRAEQLEVRRGKVEHGPQG